jgi:hypothetical protein
VTSLGAGIFYFLTFLKNIFKNNLCETLFASDNLFDRIALPGTADSLCRAPASGASDLPRRCTMVTVFVVAAPHALARQLTRANPAGATAGGGSHSSISSSPALAPAGRHHTVLFGIVVRAWWGQAAPLPQTPCSFGLSATSQQYFSLRTNQLSVLFSQNKSAPATSQTNRLVCNRPAVAWLYDHTCAWENT